MMCFNGIERKPRGCFFFCIDRISNWELKRPTKGLQNMLQTYIDMQNYILADIYMQIYFQQFFSIYFFHFHAL